jgi:single-stranded-DNA-specific exonuclease
MKVRRGDLAWLDAPSHEARELGRALGLTNTVATVLHRRGYKNDARTRRFLDPRLADLTPPDGMVDRLVAAERLAHAVRHNEPVCVFGDYDCDGITSTTILTDMLRALGGTAIPLLGSRFDGGYGVSPDAVRRIEQTGARLVVTCDCGSSDHASLRVLGAQGIECIVVDHHLVPDEPLPALAFLNPRRAECAFPYKHLASCGLVLTLGGALRSTLGKELDLRAWLDLVAIGTIADVVPLLEDNRALVRAGLRVLQKAERPGVRALLDLARVDPRGGLSARDVAFRLAPRLNAPGRLGSAEVALKLLLASNAEEAEALARAIEHAQNQRRDIQQRMMAEAQDEIEREGWHTRPAVVVGRQGWNSGVVGIVAGKLAEVYGRPVAVLGFEGRVGRGSVRGPRGMRLYDALESMSGILSRFGGHQAAAGLELELDRLEEFREGFERAFLEPRTVTAQSTDDALVVRLDPEDDPAQVLDDLALLEPCGEANPPAKLAITARVESARPVRGGHLRLELEIGGGRALSSFAPGMGARADGLQKEIFAIGILRRDGYKGGRAVELVAETLED